MALDRFPSLRGLLDDLTRLNVEEVTRQRAARGGGDGGGGGVKIVGEGRDVTTVHAPWLGRSFHLTGAQREVVRQLLHSYLHCKNPEVDERTLLARAGLPPTSRLADAFRGSPAWGELVVRGEGTATYRLAAPGREEDEETASDDDDCEL